MGDKRTERMLEEILKLPGNNNCADCHASAPRWASVNLGITLCVSCASIHRKLGTHKSRVKSITLDSWDRAAVTHLRSVGNTASNAIYNPDERRHPPPTSSSTDERDSEMEKYIRKKYEHGTFKAGASSSSAARAEPTSMNRARDARERAERTDRGIWDRSQDRGNTRNPELNDLVVKLEKKKSNTDRDLPPLPVSPAAPAAPRERPRPSPSPSPAPAAAQTLIDVAPSTNGFNSTLPLQSLPPPQQQQQQFLSPHAQPQMQMQMFGGTSPGSNSSFMSISPMQQQQQPMGYFPQQQPLMGYSPNTQMQQASYNPFLASSPGAMQQQQSNPFYQNQTMSASPGGWQQQPWQHLQQQQPQMTWQQPQQQMLSPYAGQQGMMGGGYFH